MTIAVIGAGASGMMAALTAAEQADNQILLFERQVRPGRKLMATGNGRCFAASRKSSPLSNSEKSARTPRDSS